MIDSWFQRYLRRPVDPGGLASRLGILRNGGDPQGVEADILASDEFWNRNGGNVVGFIQGMYSDILGRAPNRNEVRFWADRYLANSQNRSAVAREVLQMADRDRLRRRLN
jgi:hypothetical protein